MNELSEMSPVELLRAAAARVRERAKEVAAFCDCRGSEQRWQLDPHPTDDALVLGQCGCEMGAVAVFFGFRQDAGRWAELVHPGLAEPIAEVLEAAADGIETDSVHYSCGSAELQDGGVADMAEREYGPALRVARGVLGVPDVR